MQHSMIPDAIAVLRGENAGAKIRGTVKFFRQPEGTWMDVNVSGLPASGTGFFGFHIHEGGDCSGAGFSDTGGHYNPEKTLHPNHAGDLPPLLSAGGRAHMKFLTGRFSVGDIIGRTVVIHSGPDDFHTQPAGNAGEKIACGVIRRV